MKGKMAAAAGEHDQAHDRDRHPCPGEVEHSHRRQPGFDGKGVHDEVGGRADQGGDATQYRGVRQRQQDARGWEMALPGQCAEQRGDDRGVVDEGRSDRSEAGQAQHGERRPSAQEARRQGVEIGVQSLCVCFSGIRR